MLNRHPCTAVWSLMVLCVAGLTTHTHATAAPRTGQEILAFEGPPSITATVDVERLRPHYVDGKNASEAWSYALQFPDGTLMQLQFMVTNLGPGNHTGVFLAYVVEPDNRTTTLRNTRRRDAWEDRSSDSEVSIHIAYHTLSIADRRHRILVEHPDRGRLEIEATAVTEAFAPGRLSFPEGDWYDVTVAAPRLRATGWVQLPGQERRDLGTGRGIAIHTLSNAGDDRLATGWLRADLFGGSDEASLFEIMTSERTFRQRIGFVLQFEGDRLAGWTTRYGRRLPDPVPDPDKSSYPVFEAMRFGADSEVWLRAEARLELVVRSPLLDALNSSLLRTVLRLISDPILYLYRADASLRTAEDTAASAARGVVSLYLLDRPPSRY